MSGRIDLIRILSDPVISRHRAGQEPSINHVAEQKRGERVTAIVEIRIYIVAFKLRRAWLYCRSVVCSVVTSI